MKIDSRIYQYDMNAKVQQHVPQPGDQIGDKHAVDAPASAAQKDAQKDTVVHFSEASREAQLAREVIASAPDLRADRVEALKESIASGTYRVDHQAVADKLVNTLLDDI